MVVPLVKLLFLINIIIFVNGVCHVENDLLTLTDWTGSVKSPGYESGYYPVDQNCLWTVRVSKGSRISVKFTSFQLEDGVKTGSITTCYDRVQVIDNNDNNNTIFNGCGSKQESPSFTSSSNEITITFRSDETGHTGGFRLEYTGVCSIDIRDNTVIETPNYPGSAPDFTRCEWNIILPNKRAAVIQLNNQENNLPSCNISPLRITETKPPKKQYKLCLVESKALLFNDVTFTYDVTTDSVPWNGSLKIDFIKSPQCEYFCVNHKNCITPRGLRGQGYRCLCNEGFTGRNCDVKLEILDPCYPNSCQNEGACVQIRGVFICNCPANYTGETCETVLDPCYPKTCLNSGSCEGVDGAPACVCPSGFSGDRCEVEINPCESSPCNNGVCFRNGRDFTCMCSPNYSGKKCNIALDPCFPESCINGGACQLIDRKPTCTCPEGFTGKRCQVELDPCESLPCENSGTCYSAQDAQTFSCECLPGYVGKTCETVIDPCYPNSCVNGGVCEDGTGNPTCSCPKEFSGKRCEIESDPCGTRPCKNNGNCVSGSGTFTCACSSEFTGKLCDVPLDRDPCGTLPCQNSGTCIPGEGTYSCVCSPKFTGKICDESVDQCFPSSCMNGGTCEVIGGKLSCSCTNGFTGKRCETSVDPCVSFPCENGGTCESMGRLFKCTCPMGFTGRTCNLQYDLCLSNPCQSNATCIGKPGSYTCKCPSGYTGTNCELNIDNCALEICQNGGMCVDGVGTFSCVCPEQFTGYLCDSDVDGCVSSPCKHGRCIDGQGSFKCQCDADYRGRYCDIHKDQGYCLEERDAIVSSGILWFDTVTNVLNTQPCPPNIIGNASRLCVEDPSSDTGGKWTRPDLSECVSPEFVNLAVEASLATKVENLKGEDLAFITTNLVDITSHVKGPSTKQLYPGDLRMSGAVISLVADGLNRAETSEGTALNIAQGLTDAMDNIIDPDTISIWQNARVHIVVEGVKMLLNSTEIMAEYFRTSNPVLLARSATNEPRILRFKGRNVDLRILTVNDGENILEDSNEIVLPKEVFNTAKKYTDSVSLYNARFSSLAGLVSMKETRYGGNISESRVNSDIISSKVLGFPEGFYSNFTEPVVITFKIKDPSPTKQYLNNHCVFMKMGATLNSEQWSSEGCVLHDANSTHVTCYCYHLTNFALLLDVYGTSEQLGEANNAILSYISYIGGSLSILGCLASIIVFEYFRLKSDRIRIHEQLAASIILVQVIFLVGIGQTSDKDTTPRWACKTVAILLHYSLTALFCWMLVEGIHLYAVLVRVFKRGSHLKKYMALGWGLPLVIVGISVGAFYHKYGDGRICWLDRDMLLVGFLPTVGLVVVVNTVILVIIIRVMMRSMKSTAKVNVQEISSLKISVKAAAVLLPLLGLTWTLAFLAVNTDETQAFAYVFTYMFTIGNAFQGLVFFVFHCLMNVDVHTAFKRRYRKQKAVDTLSSRTRKSSEMDSYTVDGKGTMTPKFIAVIEKNNAKVNKPNFNPNIHFTDYDDDDDRMWKHYTMGQKDGDDPFVLRLRPTSDSDPVITEYINNIEEYLDKPSSNSVLFSSTT